MHPAFVTDFSPQRGVATARMFTAAALLALCGSAHAVTYCVGSLAELRNAASTISSTETQFDLRIRSGYYALTPVQGQAAVQIARRFDFNPPHTQPNRISGAWNAGCTAQLAEAGGANSTVLDALGQTAALRINHINLNYVPPNTLAAQKLEIDRLLIADSSEEGLVLRQVQTSSPNHWRLLDVTLDRVRVELSAGGVNLNADGEIVVRNSLLIGNTGAAIVLTSENGPIHVYNNTLRYNQNTAASNTQISLSTLAGTHFVFNNLLADASYLSPAVDIRILDGNAFVRNNRIVGNVVQQSADLLIQSGNTTALPQFVTAQNPRLASGSPLRDLGFTPPVVPGLGAVDFDGTARIQGAAPDIGAFELAPLPVIGPTLAYNPAAGTSAGSAGTVNFTGVTSAGSTGNGNISATPSGGSGGGTTSLSGFTLSGADANFFLRQSAATLTFTAGVASAQNISYTCTSGAVERSAVLQVTETIGGAATTLRYWRLVCPAGTSQGPALAYNPAAGATPGSGGPVNFTGVTTIGSNGSGSIVVTPSGGFGGGSTTLSNFTLGGSAPLAFTLTSASTLVFSGVVASQNITLTCVSGNSERTADLQATETITGGATTVRYWRLVCPAGNTVGPTLAFNPAAGATPGSGGPVAFTGVTSAGSSGTGSIVVTPSGGIGGGTTTLSAFTLSGADAAAFTLTSAATLTFTAGLAIPQSVTLSCVSDSTPRSANLQATQVVNGGATTQRYWVLECPAGSVGESIFAGGFEN